MRTHISPAGDYTAAKLQPASATHSCTLAGAFEETILPGGFPKWLRFTWLCLAPFGVSLSLRIAWEKTFLTWSNGPQMIGFSLAHLHPGFFIAGLFCTVGLAIWTIIATAYLIRGWKNRSKTDLAMYLLGLFALVAVIVPDNAFA